MQADSIGENNILSPEEAALQEALVSKAARRDSDNKKTGKKELGVKYKEISLSAFIVAFMDHSVGVTTIEKLISAGYDTLAKLKEIDSKTSYGILGNYRGLVIREFIKEYEEEMLEYIRSGKVIVHMPGVENAPLKGNSFVFTGSLETMSRNAAKEKIRIFGGITQNMVSRETDFLVTNTPRSNRKKTKWQNYMVSKK